jgi:hypothetical protein
VESIQRRLALAAAGGPFDEFDQAPAEQAQILVSARLSGGA